MTKFMRFRHWKSNPDGPASDFMLLLCFDPIFHLFSSEKLTFQTGIPEFCYVRILCGELSKNSRQRVFPRGKQGRFLRNKTSGLRTINSFLTSRLEESANIPT